MAPFKILVIDDDDIVRRTLVDLLGAHGHPVATRSIPVVALTSGTAADANRLVKGGGIGFIPRPFEPGTMRDLVAGFLKATVGRDRRAAPP